MPAVVKRNNVKSVEVNPLKIPTRASVVDAAQHPTVRSPQLIPFSKVRVSSVTISVGLRFRRTTGEARQRFQRLLNSPTQAR